MVAMVGEKVLENGEDVAVKLRGLAKRFRTRVGIETGVTDGKGERARREARFTQTLAGFLRKVAQHSGEGGVVVRVFAEGVIVRNGFGLGVDYEFIRIAATRFAIQRGAPLAENFFKFFQRLRRELFHGFDADSAECSLCDVTDSVNLAHRERLEKEPFSA